MALALKLLSDVHEAWTGTMPRLGRSNARTTSTPISLIPTLQPSDGRYRPASWRPSIASFAEDVEIPVAE